MDLPQPGTEQPEFGGDGRAGCQVIIALQGDDARTRPSRMRTTGGSWRAVMAARCRRIG
jgi:hypothetical protein